MNKEKIKKQASSEKDNKTNVQKPKSKTTLFWEQHPNGIGSKIVNMRAVLR